MIRNDGLGRRLWGAAGFRLVLLYAAVFALSSAALFAVVHWGTVGTLRAQIEQAVRADLAGLRHEAAGDGIEGLAVILRARAADLAGHPGVHYGLFAADGTRIAGDLAERPAGPGPLVLRWRDAEGEERPLIGQAEPLAGGGLLVVAREALAMQETEELLLGAFLWAGAATLLLGFGGGVLVARGFLRRVDAIATVAEAIARGDLVRRVPLPAGADQAPRDEMDRLALAINAMLDRIAALMEALRHNSAAIAHDLRTPLARLRQGLEAARGGAQGAEGYEAAIEKALAETDAILRSFSALLRIAQIEIGSRRAGFAELDLSALAAMMAEAYGPSVEDSGRRFDTEIAQGISIRGDRELLAQMIANLIENAMRHTPTGTAITLRVLHAADDGRGPCLTVEDDGPGVPAAERPRILRAFHRLDPSRADGGSGLGLALVAAVAGLHEAELALDHATPDGRGLAVRIHFPPGLSA